MRKQIINPLSVLLLKFLPAYKCVIIGDSMAPTFRNADAVLVNRIAFVLRSPQVGEIVAVKDPRDKKVLIKRVTKIGEGRYFVEGDNKQYSTDSRMFGSVRREAIIGKVIHVKHG